MRFILIALSAFIVFQSDSLSARKAVPRPLPSEEAPVQVPSPSPEPSPSPKPIDLSVVPEEMSFEWAKKWVDTVNNHLPSNSYDRYLSYYAVTEESITTLKGKLNAEGITPLNASQYEKLSKALLKNIEKEGAGVSYANAVRMASSTPVVNSRYLSIGCTYSERSGTLPKGQCGDKLTHKILKDWYGSGKSAKKKAFREALLTMSLDTLRLLLDPFEMAYESVFNELLDKDFSRAELDEWCAKAKAAPNTGQLGVTFDAYFSSKNYQTVTQSRIDAAGNLVNDTTFLAKPELKATFPDKISRFERCVTLAGWAVPKMKAYKLAYALKQSPNMPMATLVSSQNTYLTGIIDNRSFAMRIAQAYTEKHAPAPIMVPRWGQIEATTAQLSAEFKPMAANPKLNYYLKKIAPQVMPINGNIGLVQQSRQLAIDLCERAGIRGILAPEFCDVRERIHGAPSQMEIEDTKKFVAQWEKAGETKKVEIGKKLVDALETLYGGGQRAIDKGLSALENEYRAQTNNVEFKSNSTPYALFKTDLDDYINKNGNLSSGNQGWLDLITTHGVNLRNTVTAAPTLQNSAYEIKLSNILQDEGFATATQVVAQIAELPFSKQTPEDQTKIRQALTAMFNGLYAEGVIEKEFLKESIDTVNLPLTDKQMIELIEKVKNKAIGEVNKLLQEPQAMMSNLDSTATHMIENLERSSMLLPLMQLKRKFSPEKGYEVYNKGEICGKVRIIDDVSDIEGVPTGMDDILVFMGVDVPAQLGVFGGLITQDEQSALSHVDLKAANRGSPGAFSKDAAKIFEGMDKKNIRLKVTPEGLAVTVLDAPVTAPVSNRPLTTPARNLKVTQIQTLNPATLAVPEMVKAIGTKAFNYGHLDALFDDETVKPGAAIPFSFYVDFMDKSGLQAEAEALSKDPRMKTDPAFRAEILKAFQKKIEKTKIDVEVLKGIQAELQKRFGENPRLKLRSSSNSEDLPGFSGAGLYDSYAADIGDLKSLEKNLKAAWASVWNDRAYAERDVFNIAHSTVAMGLLVHESTRKEDANGVALTNSKEKPGEMKVVVQHGEVSVTNPKGGLPDVVYVDPKTKAATYDSHTTLNEGAPSLTTAQMDELTTKLGKLHDYFKTKVYKSQNINFSMDVEFKLVKGSDGRQIITIKQARPFALPAPAAVPAATKPAVPAKPAGAKPVAGTPAAAPVKKPVPK